MALSNSSEAVPNSPPPSSPPAASPLDSEEFNIASFKTFLHKKLQSAQSLIKKPKTHTCKVNLITSNESLQLVVSDGTFMNEGLTFLKDRIGPEKSDSAQNSAMFNVDNVIELGFEFDLPYDINSTQLLDEVLGVRNLKAFTLKTNYIAGVPTQILQMKGLEVLSLANNQIKSIGPEISYLPRLTALNLSNNQLTTLPKELCSLYKMKQLNLSSNYLTALPPMLNQLSALQILNLNNNRLSALPDMSGMTQLEELELENNLLTNDPSSDSIIGKVKTITGQFLGNSNLKTLSNLCSLIVLNLKSNKMISVPEYLSSLPRLQRCDLSYNAIQGGEMSSFSLLNLDLSHNMLSSLTPKITNLIALKELNVSYNMLSSLPPEMGSMTTLDTLKIANNQLRDRLEPISSITSLKSLHLGGNSISNLPLDLANLVQLQYLNLTKNFMKTIPSIIFTRLSDLRKLDLSENHLVAIPYTISNLTVLTTLRMHSNKITVLPKEMATLPQLTELSVKNLYVNANGDLNVIQTNDDSTDRVPIKICGIISLARSAPHPLLIYALYLMSEEDFFQSKIVSDGGVTDMIYLIKNYKGRTQVEATKILANLSSQESFKDLIFQEGATEVIIPTLLDESSETEAKIHSLVTLGNIGLREANRRPLVENEELVSVLRKLSKDLRHDVRISKYARRTLAILGLLDNLPPNRGIRILALDGGGSRGVTTVELLRKIEQTTGKRIHELFDLIAGTSAGGLTAASLSIRHYTLDHVKVLQERMCSEIFAHGVQAAPAEDFFASQLARLQTRFNSATQIVKSGSLYSTQKLEDLLISLAGTDELLIDSAMESDNKLFVVSTLATAFPPQIYLWRNYQYPIDGIKSRYLGSMTNKIWEALRASSCAPTYFDEFTVGNDKHQDGGCIANNPTAIAVHEARCLWPDRKIDCIVSCGTGKPPVRESKGGFLERTVTEMVESATNVDRIHELMHDTYPENIYFRFNPEDFRYNCLLDESRKEKLEEMREAAREYTTKIDDRFQLLAKILLSNGE